MKCHGTRPLHENRGKYVGNRTTQGHEEVEGILFDNFTKPSRYSPIVRMSPRGTRDGARSHRVAKYVRAHLI
jgi:hypothetical protein